MEEYGLKLSPVYIPKAPKKFDWLKISYKTIFDTKIPDEISVVYYSNMVTAIDIYYRGRVSWETILGRNVYSKHNLASEVKTLSAWEQIWIGTKGFELLATFPFGVVVDSQKESEIITAMKEANTPLRPILEVVSYRLKSGDLSKSSKG